MRKKKKNKAVMVLVVFTILSVLFLSVNASQYGLYSIFQMDSQTAPAKHCTLPEDCEQGQIVSFEAEGWVCQDIEDVCEGGISLYETDRLGFSVMISDDGDDPLPPLTGHTIHRLTLNFDGNEIKLESPEMSNANNHVEFFNAIRDEVDNKPVLDGVQVESKSDNERLVIIFHDVGDKKFLEDGTRLATSFAGIMSHRTGRLNQELVDDEAYLDWH